MCPPATLFCFWLGGCATKERNRKSRPAPQGLRVEIFFGALPKKILPGALTVGSRIMLTPKGGRVKPGPPAPAASRKKGSRGPVPLRGCKGRRPLPAPAGAEHQPRARRRKHQQPARKRPKGEGAPQGGAGRGRAAERGRAAHDSGPPERSKPDPQGRAGEPPQQPNKTRILFKARAMSGPGRVRFKPN